MKRFVRIFVPAIFVPSLVLGWLALRTAAEQRVIVERQAAGLHQVETDALAEKVRSGVVAHGDEFQSTVQALLDSVSPAALAENYWDSLPSMWRDEGVPFVISPGGVLLFPTAEAAAGNPRLRRFIEQNGAFLSNRVAAEIYPAQQFSAKTSADASARDDKKTEPSTQRAPAAAPPRPAIETPRQPSARSAEVAEQDAYLAKKPALTRNVIPQKLRPSEENHAAPLSQLEPSMSNFQSAIRDGDHGIVSRFVHDDLELLVWSRPRRAQGYVFGIMLPAARMKPIIDALLPPAGKGDVCLAVLNDNGQPVTKSQPDFKANWNRPFVSTEIGEVLPHWEAALYLLQPEKLDASARLVSLTLSLLIALALAAILTGGLFVALDTRRQLAIAQKKADFVSNVSHELKTPLTSIRMFAELLQSGKITDPEKRDHYLKVITAESERLSRLISNVLDFAKIERGSYRYDRRTFDLSKVLSLLWERYRTHLNEAGFVTEWVAAAGPCFVHADEDAICRIVLNLLSNAEKYSINGRKEITLTTSKHEQYVEVSVKDHGIGVTPADESRIFDAFYRGNDSLASRVQGTGLGLTLAKRIAEDHGGSLTYQRREGGGSTFSLKLPLVQRLPPQNGPVIPRDLESAWQKGPRTEKRLDSP